MALRWKAQAFVNGYDIEIYKGDDFSSVNRVVSASRIKTNAYVTEAPLAASSAAYRWRVRRRDSSDNEGPWTTGRFFVRPTVPILLSPATGAAQPANAPVAPVEARGRGRRRYHVTRRSTTRPATSINVETTRAPRRAPSWSHARHRQLHVGRSPRRTPSGNVIGSAIATFTVDAG